APTALLAPRSRAQPGSADSRHSAVPGRQPVERPATRGRQLRAGRLYSDRGPLVAESLRPRAHGRPYPGRLHAFLAPLAGAGRRSRDRAATDGTRPGIVNYGSRTSGRLAYDQETVRSGW